MKLYRYELFCDDEPQDVGFLVGIEDLGLSAEAEENLFHLFDPKLSIPDSLYMRDSVSFFTEEGNRRLQAEIFQVAAAYEGSMFDVKVCTLDLPNRFMDSIIYLDQDQVCIPRKLYKELDSLVTRSIFPSIEFNTSLQNKIHFVSVRVTDSHSNPKEKKKSNFIR